MFICGKCHKVTEPGEKMTRIVVEKREKEYKERGVVVGHGYETVKEIGVCNNCAK